MVPHIGMRNNVGVVPWFHGSEEVPHGPAMHHAAAGAIWSRSSALRDLARSALLLCSAEAAAATPRLRCSPAFPIHGLDIFMLNLVIKVYKRKLLVYFQFFFQKVSSKK